jgi:hypothetical protein
VSCFLINPYNHGWLKAPGPWKLIVGGSKGEAQASWYGHFSPNASGVPSLAFYDCAEPCLFNIETDPTGKFSFLFIRNHATCNDHQSTPTWHRPSPQCCGSSWPRLPG